MFRGSGVWDLGGLGLLCFVFEMCLQLWPAPLVTVEASGG